jgi:gas vesicle protein
MANSAFPPLTTDTLYFSLSGATIAELGIVRRFFVMADDNGNSFLWFLAGLGIGAVVGVLYAPKSGAELRADIRNKFDDTRELINEKAAQAREQATEWVERGRDVLSSQKEQFRSAYEAGKQAYREVTTSPQTQGPEKL